MSNNCPKCGKEFDEVNGLYVKCNKCDYINDSTLGQITSSKDFKWNRNGLECEKE